MAYVALQSSGKIYVLVVNFLLTIFCLFLNALHHVLFPLKLVALFLKLISNELEPAI